jgi:fucose 4-O-acetylase-like acetyltransferase
MVWVMVECLIRVVFLVVSGNAQSVGSWFEELKPYLFSAERGWFLKELFISYLIAYASWRLLKKELLACLVSIGFVLIAPHGEIQRVLLPMFWVGIYLKDHYSLLSKYATQILMIAGGLFLAGLLFWDGNYTMYGTVSHKLFDIRALKFDFTAMDISVFRLLIGLCGSLFWFMLFQKVYKSNTFFVRLSKIGVNTLAIYLLHEAISGERIGRIISFPDTNIWIYTLIITPLASLAILGISLLIIKVVQKNKYAELLLFGKQ